MVREASVAADQRRRPSAPRALTAGSITRYTLDSCGWTFFQHTSSTQKAIP